jgi:sulfur-oxidizing protein SoxY
MTVQGEAGQKMKSTRRTFLQSGLGVLIVGLFKPIAAGASWNKAAFEATSMADALRELGAVAAKPTNLIRVDVPDVVEHGALVPVEITSDLTGTKALSLLISKNPAPFVARFQFMAGAVPFVRLNVRMAESSWLHVVAEADGKHYVATRQVTISPGVTCEELFE